MRSPVLLFQPIHSLRPAKASLRDNRPPLVKEVVALAPVLWRRSPPGLAAARDFMQNLIDGPPRGGRKVPAIERATAAHRPVRRPLPAPTPAESCQALIAAASMALARGELPIDWDGLTVPVRKRSA